MERRVAHVCVSASHFSRSRMSSAGPRVHLARRCAIHAHVCERCRWHIEFRVRRIYLSHTHTYISRERACGRLRVLFPLQQCAAIFVYAQSTKLLYRSITASHIPACEQSAALFIFSLLLRPFMVALTRTRLRGSFPSFGRSFCCRTKTRANVQGVLEERIEFESFARDRGERQSRLPGRGSGRVLVPLVGRSPTTRMIHFYTSTSSFTSHYHCLSACERTSEQLTTQSRTRYMYTTASAARTASTARARDSNEP